MDCKRVRWQIAGFLFTAVAGTALHFFYDLSGQLVTAALISPVNESIWEHMKLLYFPMLLFALAEYRYIGREIPGFWCAKAAGMVLGLALIPVLYYTAAGALGWSADWFNVTIFYLAAGAAYALENRLFSQSGKCRPWIAVVVLVIIGAAFAVFTFFPPRIPLFQDPIGGGYGI